ncbi:MAG: methyltransferase [Hyphomonadaceae bacterium]|nr:methyltransferase [Hyphomonadaceae bacterium]
MADLEMTEDALLDGRIRVRQPARGYRVNVDTLLLAAAVETPRDGGRLLEAGCGVGAALLAIAIRNENVKLVGVERDQNIASISRENVAANAMMHRIEIVTGDALDRALHLGVFDGVFANPPFDSETEGRAPAESRRYAHVSNVPLDAWVASLADRLTGGAALTMIHRAAKLPDLLSAFDGRLGGVEVLPVRTYADMEAKRVLLRGRKGSRAPFKLLKGIDLHDRSGSKHTAEVEAILRGERLINWGAG